MDSHRNRGLVWSLIAVTALVAMLTVRLRPPGPHHTPLPREAEKEPVRRVHNLGSDRLAGSTPTISSCQAGETEPLRDQPATDPAPTDRTEGRHVCKSAGEALPGRQDR